MGWSAAAQKTAAERVTTGVGETQEGRRRKEHNGAERAEAGMTAKLRRRWQRRASSKDWKEDSPERSHHNRNNNSSPVVTLKQWRVNRDRNIKGRVFDHSRKENGTPISITPAQPIVGKNCFVEPLERLRT